jgi:hypothetical protein
VARARGVAPPLYIASHRNPFRCQIQWLIGGAYMWECDRRLLMQLGSDHHDRKWANQFFISCYGALFTAMWPQRHWWFLVDITTNIASGVVAALPALSVHRDDAHVFVPRVCAGSLHALTAIQLVYAVAFVLVWPAAVRWESLASMLTATLGAVVALLASLEAAGVEGLDDAADGLAAAQLAVTILVAVLGVSEEVFAVLTSQLSRRFRFQSLDNMSRSPAAGHIKALLVEPPLAPMISAHPISLLDDASQISSGFPSPEMGHQRDVDAHEMLVSLVMRITQDQRHRRRRERKEKTSS